MQASKDLKPGRQDMAKYLVVGVLFFNWLPLLFLLWLQQHSMSKFIADRLSSQSHFKFHGSATYTFSTARAYSSQFGQSFVSLSTCKAAMDKSCHTKLMLTFWIRPSCSLSRCNSTFSTPPRLCHQGQGTMSCWKQSIETRTFNLLGQRLLSYMNW
jgi:hypothetical protein